MKKVKDYTNEELLEEVDKRRGTERDDFTRELAMEVYRRRILGTLTWDDFEKYWKGTLK